MTLKISDYTLLPSTHLITKNLSKCSTLANNIHSKRAQATSKQARATLSPPAYRTAQAKAVAPIRHRGEKGERPKTLGTRHRVGGPVVVARRARAPQRLPAAGPAPEQSAAAAGVEAVRGGDVGLLARGVAAARAARVRGGPGAPAADARQARPRARAHRPRHLRAHLAVQEAVEDGYEEALWTSFFSCSLYFSNLYSVSPQELFCNNQNSCFFFMLHVATQLV